MIYFVIFGLSEEEVMRLEGVALTQYIAKSLEEAEQKALEEMRQERLPYAVIFVETPEPVKLSLLSLDDEAVKALGNLGAWVKEGE